MLTYSPTSAFWLFNLVANLCYMRYDAMSSDAVKVQKKLESGYIAEVGTIDNSASKVMQGDEKAARKILTDYSVKTAQNTFSQWKALSEYLIVKYIDGNIKKEKDGKFERNAYGYPVMPSQPGYSDTWKKDVVQDTGDKLLVPAGASH